MKRLSLIIAIILLSTQLFSQSTILIQDAIEKNIIKYKVTGSWNDLDKLQFMDADGQYFGKCMTIEIYNKADSAIYIRITNGLMLMCEDTNTQDMIITKPIYVQLQPKENKTIELYAMCSEIHDNMPTRGTRYKIGTMADKNLIKITQAIDDMFMHNIVGQGAIWAYTDSATVDDLKRYGANDNSLKITIQILDKADVYTKINPKKIDTMLIDSTVAKNEVFNESEETKNVISLNENIVYTGSGLILLLIGSTIFLLIKRRKTDNKDQTV